jgi:hypothetical protein
MTPRPGDCQRWRPGGIPSWRRPEDGGFDARRYGVADIEETPAKRFVCSFHYSATYPAAAQRYGMFDLADEARLVGVAVLSVPAQKALLTCVFPRLEPYQESLELGRFVLRDEVPANGESARSCIGCNNSARSAGRDVVRKAT